VWEIIWIAESGEGLNPVACDGIDASGICCSSI